MRYKWFAIIAATLVVLAGCSDNNEKEDHCNESLDFARQQFSLLLKDATEFNRIPRTVSESSELHWTNTEFDWTEGFFPGVCWYMYEYDKDSTWIFNADKFQRLFERHRYLTINHDLGFVFNCSYGNGYRLTANEKYKEVLIDAGNSLIERFNPKVGCIQSWDVNKGWQAHRGWEFPVIIDNMMNLELLFELSKITGDMKYLEIAKQHANITIRNHFRSNGSSYHVVDYDSITGAVRNKQTAQGYAHESVWARGQAWGLYGFIVCYRYTQEKSYLEQAIKIANYICENKQIPDDHIPYWDYNAPRIPNELRDVSAAAITASALLELSEYTDCTYLHEAKNILKSLSSSQYRAKLGENNHFILKHSVGSIPHSAEIDVPLIYADYYYVEALLRLKKLLKVNS